MILPDVRNLIFICGGYERK